MVVYYRKKDLYIPAKKFFLHKETKKWYNKRYKDVILCTSREN